jgi:hypothetical protein
VPIREQLARNETLFRSINERIRELGRRFGMSAETLDFICECSDETCTDRVSLTVEQYDHVRSLPTRFVVAPGHETAPLVEQVLFRNPGFVVVKKVGVAADIAEADAPAPDLS